MRERDGPGRPRYNRRSCPTRHHAPPRPGPRAARADDRRGGLVPRLRRRLLLRSAAVGRVRAAGRDDARPALDAPGAGRAPGDGLLPGLDRAALPGPRARGGAARPRDRRSRRPSPARRRDDARRSFARTCSRARESIEEAARRRAERVPRRRVVDPRRRDAARSASSRAAGFRCDASMMPVPPLGSAGQPAGARTGSSATAGRSTEVPPLTGRVLRAARCPSGGAWPFRMLSAGAARRAPRSAFRDRGRAGRLHAPPLGVRPGASRRWTACPPLTRAVHFAGLSGFPERFDALARAGRCVALARRAAARSCPA